MIGDLPGRPGKVIGDLPGGGGRRGRVRGGGGHRIRHQHIRLK